MAQTSIVGPNWETYSYTYGDGLLARIHFDVQAAEETPHSGPPHCTRVILSTPAERVRKDGQPGSADEMESLLVQQRRLIDLLTSQSVVCRFVGSMLYGGMFDLLFQVSPNHFRSFNAVVTQWTTTSQYRIEMRQSEGWDYFDAKIRPGVAHAQQITDKRVVQSLIDAGSDPKKIHRLDHLILGAPKILRGIARDLEANGFVRPRIAKDTLLISTESSLDLQRISKTTGALATYCASCGARYDGWGADVVRSVSNAALDSPSR